MKRTIPHAAGKTNVNCKGVTVLMTPTEHQHCKGGMKRPVLTNGGEQEINFIPEGDVYHKEALNWGVLVIIISM